MRRDAFLARRHQAERQRPFVQRDMAAFHDGADRDSERFAAGVALIHAGAMRLAFNERRLFDHAAMRANGLAIWPADRLEIGARRVLIVENRVCEIEGHGKLLCPEQWQNPDIMSSA